MLSETPTQACIFPWRTSLCTRELSSYKIYTWSEVASFKHFMSLLVPAELKCEHLLLRGSQENVLCISVVQSPTFTAVQGPFPLHPFARLSLCDWTSKSTKCPCLLNLQLHHKLNPVVHKTPRKARS